MNAAAMMCLALSSVMLSEYSLNDIAKVERQAIANRLAIQRWHVRIAVVFDRARSKDSSPPHEMTLYFDGKQQRCDDRLPYKEKVPGVSEDHYTSIEVWSEKERYKYSTQRFPDREPSDLTVTPRDMALKELGGRSPNIDIRVLGFLPTGLAFEGSITTLIGNPDRTNLSMVDEILNGIPCKKICCVKLNKKKNPVQYRVWIAPSMGYSVIRNEAIRDYADGQARQCTDLTVKEYRSTGLWFPVSSVCEVLDNGKRVLHEKLAIEVLSLNEPLAPKFFTIADLNVPPGTGVSMYPSSPGAQLVWDGKEIRMKNDGK